MRRRMTSLRLRTLSQKSFPAIMMGVRQFTLACQADLQSKSKRPSLRPLTAPLLAGGMLALTAQWAFCDGSEAPGKPKLLSKEAVRNAIDESLKSFRKERFLRKGSQTPMIKLAEKSIFVPLPWNAHVGSVLIACLGALQEGGVVSTFHTGLPAADPQDLSLSFSLAGSGSVLLRLSESPKGEAYLTIYRDGGFSLTDVNAVTRSYIAGWGKPLQRQNEPTLDLQDPLDLIRRDDGVHQSQRPHATPSLSPPRDAVTRLKHLGVEVFQKSDDNATLLDWSCLAGYESVKEEVSDTIVTALHYPDRYDAIARKTRARFEPNRPRAVLFEGPPGTGKTLCAKIIASQTEIPLVYVSVECVMSKWFGESENKLRKIFELCHEMGGALIFVDEVDALATSRDSGNMHEATRRVLSVILQHIDGFRGRSDNVFIAATNRKQDLDAALLSRFDTIITFNAPDAATRAAVFARYARHLATEALESLSNATEGFSCREIKEVCDSTERRWASKVIRKQEHELTPPLKAYMQSALGRRRSQHQVPHHAV